ncbi:MAG: hypothetical protein PWP27_1355 [Clostridiales bacterium]|jgi:glyoxylase-like metal-dependent hydrolase (beta-lactamase superfamily II)|nr:hypothetical protein [Clostridiales bacterium]MDK2933545.1 hypothetical protein [Clostridiales bacterium]
MIKVKGNTYYIPGPVCIGVYVQGKECMLIDTGLDERSAKKILKELEQEGLTPTVIINTHSHADHFGGNFFIQKKKEVVTCTSAKESVGLQYPIYEPFYLFSASPLKEMQNKFFMGKQSKFDQVLKPGREQVNQFQFEVVSLPGHSIDQIGVVTNDNVLFCADTVISREIIDKYDLPYVYDVGQHMNSLKYIKESSFDAYVMAHGGAVEDITTEVDINLKVVQEIQSYLLDVLHEPMTREDILAKFVQYKNISLSMVQYPLLFASLSAYLSYMADHDMIEYYLDKGKLYWIKGR